MPWKLAEVRIFLAEPCGNYLSARLERQGSNRLLLSGKKGSLGRATMTEPSKNVPIRHAP